MNTKAMKGATRTSNARNDCWPSFPSRERKSKPRQREPHIRYLPSMKDSKLLRK